MTSKSQKQVHADGFNSGYRGVRHEWMPSELTPEEALEWLWGWAEAWEEKTENAEKATEANTKERLMWQEALAQLLHSDGGPSEHTAALLLGLRGRIATLEAAIKEVERHFGRPMGERKQVSVLITNGAAVPLVIPPWRSCFVWLPSDVGDAIMHARAILADGWPTEDSVVMLKEAADVGRPG